MAKTSTELFNKALNLLGVVGAGQTASAEDTTIARDALQPLLSELALAEVAYIPVDPVDLLSEDIPDEYFNGLAILLANDIGPNFGIPQVSEVERQTMMNRMRRVSARGPQGFVQEALYY